MLHALYMSIRSRRVDVAIMKGIGADRRWITRVVHSQATLLALVPLVIGVPIGLVAGSRFFHSFVDRIGALPDPTFPVVAIVAVAVGLLVLANLAAMLPARRARHVRTATLLRVE
jgi:putative ABC transport system permease protein